MKKILSILKKDLFILIIILGGFIFSVYVYKLLPNKIPIHWNANVNKDSYVNKFYGCFSIPLLNMFIYFLFSVLSFIDSEKEKNASSKYTYQYLKYLGAIFLFAIEVVTLLAEEGIINNKFFYVQILVSILFILIGNVMGRFKENCILGIRTPWTLSSEYVWKKTHRMAGPLWVIGGFLNFIMLFTPINPNKNFSVTVTLLIAISPMIYSYVIYTKSKKR